MWAESSIPSSRKAPDKLGKEKDAAFHELIQECKHNAPGARLSAKLRTSLERFVPLIRREVASREKDACAPLFIACKRGNIEIVEYLLTVCKVDIEQRGLYEVPDDRSMHSVTPFWCAAVSGKLDVLKCLKRHGADINSISDTGSTPIRSACFMTNLNIVQFLIQCGADIQKCNYNGGNCLINSIQSVPLCKYLLDNGADVNAMDIENKTALHYAIQEHRLEPTILLLDHGANPFSRTRSGDDALQTACLKGATQIFSMLCDRISYPMERLADAHELIGSTLLDDFNDVSFAMNHWIVATQLRMSDPGQYLEKRPVVPPRSAYRRAVEFRTPEDLDAMSGDIDALRIQSLLVCERILGPAHKDTVFRLMYRGACYADALRYQRCMDMWMWALQIRIEKDTLLCTDTGYTVQALVKLILEVWSGRSSLMEGQVDRHRRLPRFCDVQKVFSLLADNLYEAREILKAKPVYKKQSEMFDRTLKCITHLIYLMLETAEVQEELHEVKVLVTKLVKQDIRSAYTGDTLLHLSVSRLNIIKSTYFSEDAQVKPIFPHIGVAKLLLDCGSDANARNESKSTALHVASIPYNFSTQDIATFGIETDEYYDIQMRLVKLLLENGAHIDQPNRFGDAPSFLITMNPKNEIPLVKYSSLKCLSARVVVENRIPFTSGVTVPSLVGDFIRYHQP